MATIRHLEKKDQKQVMDLFFQLTKNPSPLNIDELISDSACTCIVIENDEKVVGFACLVTYFLPTAGKVAKIEDVIVDEEYRGKGYGKLLLNKLLNIAKEKGCKKIQLTSSPKRETARKMYQSLGFEIKDTNVFIKNLV